MKRLACVAFGVSALATTTAHAGGVMFQDVPNAFGEQPCGGDGCYTRYLRLADIDSDGDLDVLMANGGFADEPLVVYANDGAAGFTNVSAAAVGGHTGNIWQIAVGDIDGDGDLDVHAPDLGGPGAMFVNDGSGVFVDEGDARLPADPVATESTRFGDVDGDADLDLVVAGNGAAVYLNDGDGVFTVLADAIPDGAGGDVNDIDLFDADRDFDLDLLTNDHGGANRIWTNDGSGTFAATDFSSSGGLHYGPGVCDIDGDTDLDIWIDNQGPGYTERLWRNDGNIEFTDVTVAQVSGNPGGDDNGIMCADVDSDGDLDAIVVALSSPERLLENDGAGSFTYQAGAFSGPTDSTLWAEMGDLDGDHRLDVVTGEGESGSFIDRVFLGTDLVPVDGTAPRIIVAEDPPEDVVGVGETAPVRFAVSDDALSDHGPRLSSAYALIDPDGVALEVAAVFVGGDLFRVALPGDGPGGSVTYRLCAVDHNDNTGCSADFVYEAAGGGDDTGETSDTGETGDTSGDATATDPTSADTSGATDPTTDPTNATTDPSATDPSADSSGGESGDDVGAGDDGGGGSGCGCATSREGAFAMPWLVIAIAARRRRRT